MAAVTICSDFGAPQNKVSHCFCHEEVMGPDGMIFIFWMLSFKPTFSVSSFTFIKRLFSSSSLSAIRVVSSAYLRLLIFLLEVLISACASSSPAFLTMYSAYKSNEQGDNIQPWRTPFPIGNQSVVPCLVLTVASWPAYRHGSAAKRSYPSSKVRGSGREELPHVWGKEQQLRFAEQPWRHPTSKIRETLVRR